jgi:hypothetical protein
MWTFVTSNSKIWDSIYISSIFALHFRRSGASQAWWGWPLNRNNHVLWDTMHMGTKFTPFQDTRLINETSLEANGGCTCAAATSWTPSGGNFLVTTWRFFHQLPSINHFTKISMCYPNSFSACLCHFPSVQLLDC